MELDATTADPKLLYSMMIRAINPRPIAWVSTISPEGITNLAPFSYFNGVGSLPPALMFSVVNLPDGTHKDTAKNIAANGQFVVNTASFAQASLVQATAEPLAYEKSEFESFGLTEVPSKIVAPPRVGESPIQIECELHELVHVGEGPLAANVIIGKILMFHIDEQVLDDQGKIDPVKLDNIGRMGGREYCRTRDRFVP